MAVVYMQVGKGGRSISSISCRLKKGIAANKLLTTVGFAISPKSPASGNRKTCFLPLWTQYRNQDTVLRSYYEVFRSAAIEMVIGGDGEVRCRRYAVGGSIPSDRSLNPFRRWTARRGVVSFVPHYIGNIHHTKGFRHSSGIIITISGVMELLVGVGQVLNAV